MDKKTIIAVVVSVVIITVGFFIQNAVQQRRAEEAGGAPQTALEEPRDQVSEPQTTEEQLEQAAETPGTGSSEGTSLSYLDDNVEPAGEDPEDGRERLIKAETDLFEIVFSNRGGTIRSLKLKEHREKDESLVDLIYRGTEEQSAFNIHFGGPSYKPVDSLFSYRQVGNDSYEFSRDFRAPADNGGEGNIFTITKRYVFKPGEYLFELHVEIENAVNEYPNLDVNNTSYTLSFGPQLGPAFQELDGRRAYRKAIYYADSKRQNLRLGRDGIGLIERRSLWQGISGKYFSILAVPDSANYTVSFYQGPVEGIPVGTQMYLARPPIKSSANVDTFRFYMGPNLAKPMARYDDPRENAFGTQGLNLDEAIDRSRILGWLESILRWILTFFYRLIPNYGVAIILLTIVIKIVLYPITKKSYESTSKMQDLNPKIQEIKEKYKDNPQKMNQEMSALYKREGVSPLGGCLPLLLQMPIFIALYGLLNKHFALRGAAFIPGWINDLSSPESIFNFAPTSIPVIGSDIRLLPILFVGTQLISSKFMQSPSQGSQANMKLMTYAMPIVFFFILYDAPSGLILYWTITNLLTVVQQYVIKKIRHRKTE
ncbi:MAG: membrane protein insertase YidC [Spirochaetia bacterium]